MVVTHPLFTNLCDLPRLSYGFHNVKIGDCRIFNWRNKSPTSIHHIYIFVFELFRDRSRAVATSKMRRFVIIVNGFHKALHLGCCSSPRSAFVLVFQEWLVIRWQFIVPRTLNIDHHLQYKRNKNDS